MVAKDGAVNGGQIELGESQLKILQLIKENPSVSRQSLAQSMGINQSVVQKHLETLKQNGLITRIGGTRGYWKIIEADSVGDKNQ